MHDIMSWIYINQSTLSTLYNVRYDMLIKRLLEIGLRCDGSPDCTDDSDEFKCDILIKDANYNKDIISDVDKNNIDIFVDLMILDIIAIEDNHNLFRSTFQLSLQWQDYRSQVYQGCHHQYKILVCNFNAQRC